MGKHADFVLIDQQIYTLDSSSFICRLLGNKTLFV
jgi:hypothetical protein